MALSLDIDLHIHSTFSDGMLDPVQLVDLAAGQGLFAISITDHDTADGTAEALERGKERGVEVLTGIEMSTWHGETSMHILGYCFNHDNAEFNAKLQALQQGRAERNIRIIENLNRLGVKAGLEELQQYSAFGQTGRPHIARLLVDKGVVESVEQAFRQYLARGAPAYAERFRFTAENAIAMIRGAGGIAVLAHPGTLDPSLQSIPALLRDLQRIGLEGVEAYYPSHSPKAARVLQGVAWKTGLLVTGGSDYHNSERSGSTIKEWLQKTTIPYELVADMRERSCRNR